MKTKILLIMSISTLEFGTKNAGGVDSVCQEILKQIIKKNSREFDYRILAFDPYSAVTYSAIPLQLADNVSVVTASSNEKICGVKLPGLLTQLMRIRQQVNDYNPDVVHAHASPWLVGINKRHHRIATLHAYKWICRKKVSALNDFLYVKALPAISNLFTDEYTCVGDIIKKDLGKDTKNPIHLIENPINEAFFTRHHRTSSEPIKLVTCSVITPRKRLDRIISLVSDLVSRNINVELTIIGPSNNKDYNDRLIAQINEYKLLDRIIFTGRKNTFEIADIYKKSDFGVFLSEEETFGLAPLEMLASGLPIIATPVGVLADDRVFFSGNGVCYFDSNSNFSAVIEFINPKTESHKNIQHSYLEERFTSSSIVRMYEKLYTLT